MTYQKSLDAVAGVADRDDPAVDHLFQRFGFGFLLGVYCPIPTPLLSNIDFNPIQRTNDIADQTWFHYPDLLSAFPHPSGCSKRVLTEWLVYSNAILPNGICALCVPVGGMLCATSSAAVHGTKRKIKI